MGVEVHFWEPCVKIVEWCPSTYNCKKLRDFIIHGPQGSENLEKSLHASCKAKTQQGTRSVNTLWHCIRKCNLKLYAKQKPFMNTLGLSSSKIDWCKVEKCRWASCPLGQRKRTIPTVMDAKSKANICDVWGLCLCQKGTDRFWRNISCHPSNVIHGHYYLFQCQTTFCTCYNCLALL